MVGWLDGWMVGLLLRYCIIDWIGFDCFMSLLYYDTTCSTKVKNKSTNNIEKKIHFDYINQRPSIYSDNNKNSMITFIKIYIHIVVCNFVPKGFINGHIPNPYIAGYFRV